MPGTPTGLLRRTDAGFDLVLPRVFDTSTADLWASVTEPERTAGWFGPWEGEGTPGRTIRVQMAFEDGQPWMDLRIDACERERRLAVSSAGEGGGWRMELLLSEVDGKAELRLVHHLDGTEGIGEIGPGWEYYLDLLAASREGTTRPEFGDYFPAMRPYYATLSTSESNA